MIIEEDENTKWFEGVIDTEVWKEMVDKMRENGRTGK